ncbi:hypothetical protein Agabi119p4_10060 [Agaricus bisporus var. burnettii]|uniref:Uncharacterized protein n=1 Tax=Agaricus bisporus var. burnettii TaxID=192524 RepID=A0A8H7C1K4_AGABI|nr:hypothetical protein Agabi119p4_10060 [Agaricus bisporus var. burnettii]
MPGKGKKGCPGTQSQHLGLVPGFNPPPYSKYQCLAGEQVSLIRLIFSREQPALMRNPAAVQRVEYE